MNILARYASADGPEIVHIVAFLSTAELGISYAVCVRQNGSFIDIITQQLTVIDVKENWK